MKWRGEVREEISGADAAPSFFPGVPTAEAGAASMRALRPHHFVSTHRNKSSAFTRGKAGGTPTPPEQEANAQHRRGNVKHRRLRHRRVGVEMTVRSRRDFSSRCRSA